MSDDHHDCQHRMHHHCPGCGRELWAPSVFAFSHGTVRCQCGYKVELEGEK